jgi:hypothetical protein
VTLAALFMVFMLASRALLIRKIEIVAHSTERSSAFKRVAARIASSAGDYMWVQTVTGAIVGGGCGIALYVIGLHNAAFWAVLIFLLAYVPVVGVTIGTVAATLFALVQFPTYWQAVAIFLSTQVIASLVGNLLLPKMQADKQNLDPTVSIFAVALWSLLWGIPGALLAIPLTVMLMIMSKRAGRPCSSRTTACPKATRRARQDRHPPARRPGSATGVYRRSHWPIQAVGYALRPQVQWGSAGHSRLETGLSDRQCNADALAREGAAFLQVVQDHARSILIVDGHARHCLFEGERQCDAWKQVHVMRTRRRPDLG